MKTSKVCVTGLYEGNLPVTGGSPSQKPRTGKIFTFDDVITSNPSTVTLFNSLLGYLSYQQCLRAIPDQTCYTHIESMYSLNIEMYGTEERRYFDDLCG